MLWRSPFVIRRLLQRVVKRNITVHIPWLLVTGSVLLYAWRLRRKQVSCHASVQTSFQTKAEARSDGRKENEGKRRFLQKVVVITGAAGDIGNATASAFAREGASIVLVDLPQTLPQLEDQCKELQASGAYKTVVLCADMTREEEVQSMVAKTVERLGPINCFFNNAGIQGELAPIHHQNSKLAQRVIQVNVIGAFFGLKHVSGAMAESGGGVIVNTASLAGLLGPRYMAAYAASKHAVIGMTKSAAKDLAPHGVRVCAVAPGILEGRMWLTQVEGRARCALLAKTGEDRKPTESELRAIEEVMVAGTPLGRLGRLSEVAQAVLFLCSEDASYLTGTVLTVDGGRLP